MGLSSSGRNLGAGGLFAYVMCCQSVGDGLNDSRVVFWLLFRWISAAIAASAVPTVPAYMSVEEDLLALITSVANALSRFFEYPLNCRNEKDILG